MYIIRIPIWFDIYATTHGHPTPSTAFAQSPHIQNKQTHAKRVPHA